MNGNAELSLFLSDARRFILQNRSIIDYAPLQLYSSAMVFAPKESVIRSTFEQPIPWISRLPKVPQAWSLELQKLEGHGRGVNAVAFSHDSQLLASASEDNTVRLWNPATGEQGQQLEGHSNGVSAVAFSHDGQLLASASWDMTVRLWNPATGEEVETLEQGVTIHQLRFSSDSQCLQTDKGILRLHSRPVTVWSKLAGDIFLNGDWITCDSRNLLWLPHDYRGTCSASRSNLLVIGQSSGQVHFIECSPLSVIV